VVKSASEIDQQLENWSLGLPDGYKYQIFDTPEELLRRSYDDNRGIYGEVYHVYTDIFHASVWNSYRSIRILVLELLFTYISYLPSSYDFDIPSGVEDNENLIGVSRSKITQLCEDVLASVPFHFNTHLQVQNQLWTRPPPRALNGELLMWSLYTCAVAGLVSSGAESRSSSCTVMTPDGGIVEMSMMNSLENERRDSGISMHSSGGERMEVRNKRRWICARLRDVAREMGVLHAEGLAFVAGRNREVDVWQTDGRSKKSSCEGFAGKEGCAGMDEGIGTEGWESEGVTRENPVC
jgi:hypothetical protein